MENEVKPDVVALAFSLSTPEAEAGGISVRRRPTWSFLASQGYVMRPCQNQKCFFFFHTCVFLSSDFSGGTETYIFSFRYALQGTRWSMQSLGIQRDALAGI